MLTHRTSVVALLLLVAGSAAADVPARPSLFGVSVDVGMPDIIGVALAVRPLSWLRVQAGGTSDLFSGGLDGAVTFIPLRRLVSPAFSLAGGYAFAAPTLGVPRAFGINADGQRVGYGWVAAQAGIEVGALKRVAFSLQAGVSLVELSVTPDGTRPSNFDRAALTVWTPSGKAAVTVFW